MPASGTRNQGKSGFVKEFLNDNPESNPAAVADAWTAAGMPGSISASLVNKIRSELGLTGNLRGSGAKPGKKAKSTAKKPGRKPKAVAATGGAGGRRSRALAEVEAALDHLLFKVMGVGDLPKVEESLRETRRALYRHLSGQ